ncbi:MAG: DUF5915 domain-containing protein [Rickettsiales bacterium]|jgi:isoleucyl-tRNA synthetase|nr:DUF5915 domain-containing protein [Rickettsiales bacterium]
MTDYNSVHLQDFPDVSKIVFDGNLVDEMDLARDICYVALTLRDKQNLRVRLPLRSVKIIGDNIEFLNKYKALIADEINVKDVLFENDISKYADFILEVDLKKLGAKYGEKLKEIMKNVKSNVWEKINDNNVKVGDFLLEKEEFTIKLKSKDDKLNNILPLSNNKMLIELDFTITKELEMEGIARDLVRTIQQTRKDKGFDIADRINLTLKTNNDKTIEAINTNGDYIKQQTLSLNLKVESCESELEIEIEKI